MSGADLAIWSVTALATAGVILRPFRWPEAVWAVAGALALVCFGLLSVSTAWVGIGKGLDVYLFLTGMMLLAEVARETGLFDWIASLAAAQRAGALLSDCSASFMPSASSSPYFCPTMQQRWC